MFTVFICHVLIVDFDLSIILRWEDIRKRAKVILQVKERAW